MNNKRKYDSTIARIAGNILSGARLPISQEGIVLAVRAAREIVTEVERTEPIQEQEMK